MLTRWCLLRQSCALLARAATMLSIPTIAAKQDSEYYAETMAEIAAELPQDATVVERAHATHRLACLGPVCAEHGRHIFAQARRSLRRRRRSQPRWARCRTPTRA